MGRQKNRRPQLDMRGAMNRVAAATSANLALAWDKTYLLTSTSTGNGTATVFALSAPLFVGQEVTLVCNSVGATSSPQHINAPTGFAFDSTSNMVTLSTSGAAARLQALSTSLIGLVGQFGASLSTST